MSTQANEELLSRALVAQVLRAADWHERLDQICANIQRAGENTPAAAANPPATMRRVATRAQDILREIAASDALTVGRLYFDLLPRDPQHPLTNAVIAALSDRRAVVRMLRECGTKVDVRKDEEGVDYLTIHDVEHADGLGDGFKRAIQTAMTLSTELGRRPHGDLLPIH